MNFSIPNSRVVRRTYHPPNVTKPITVQPIISQKKVDIIAGDNIKIESIDGIFKIHCVKELYKTPLNTEQQIKDIQHQIEQMQNDESDFNKRLTLIQNDVNKWSFDIKESVDSVSKANKQLAQLLKQITATDHRVAGVGERITDLEAHLAQDVKKMQNRINDIIIQTEKTDNFTKETQDGLVQVDSRITKTEARMARTESRMSETEGRVIEALTKSKNAYTQVDDMKHDLLKLIKECGISENKLQQKTNQIEQQVIVNENNEKQIKQQVITNEKKAKEIEQQVTINEKKAKEIEQQVITNEKKAKEIEQQVTINEKQIKQHEGKLNILRENQRLKFAQVMRKYKGNEQMIIVGDKFKTINLDNSLENSNTNLFKCDKNGSITWTGDKSYVKFTFSASGETKTDEDILSMMPFVNGDAVPSYIIVKKGPIIDSNKIGFITLNKNDILEIKIKSSFETEFSLYTFSLALEFASLRS